MPAGRPTKYKPEFCDLVVEVGKKGGWICEMAEACDVHRSTFPEWEKEHPAFSAAFMRAKQKAQAWFETKGRTGLEADKFNSALWAKQMSARHREEYTERREVDSTHNLSDPLTDLIAEISGAGRRITDGNR